MAVCEKCGRTYLTKVCPCFLDNKKNKNKNEDTTLQIAIIIILLALIAIAGMAYFMIEQYKENKEQTERLIKIQNEYEKTIKRKDKLIDHYQKEIKNLTKEIRDLKRDKRIIKSSRNNKNNPTSKKYYSKNNNYKKYNNNTKTKEKTTYKKYQRFSKNIELVSDSRIKMKSNGLLVANAPIYGRYYAKPYSIVNSGKNQISNIKCGLKVNRYRVVDECSMLISDAFDKVYLGEMDAKSIQDFDYRTHMIECEYNKQYGVMHNCKIKMK